MNHDDWKYYTDRLMAYASFTGMVDGITHALESGWTSKEEAVIRLREVLAKLQATLAAQSLAAVGEPK